MNNKDGYAVHAIVRSVYSGLDEIDSFEAELCELLSTGYAPIGIAADGYHIFAVVYKKLSVAPKKGDANE